MKETRLIMGMPITVEIVPTSDALEINEEKSMIRSLEAVFGYFRYVDEKFSVYKETSEVMRFNRKEIGLEDASQDLKDIFAMAQKTKEETDGFFDIVNRKGLIDPSGIVKGWAILNAAKILDKIGYANYYVEAGGDIQVKGKNKEGQTWKIGIKNPFRQDEIVKAVSLSDRGIATSGTYIRGQHIYDPRDKDKEIQDVVSLTVIGPNVYEADRFATAAFAMGKKGIEFIEKLDGLEGYIIDAKGVATMTSGFESYTK